LTQRLTIDSRDGLRLEAELDRPGVPGGALVFCHPHPKMGGTMHAPLLLALRDVLVDHNWSVLRFNFRGIGDSEGEASLGIAEVADVQGAIDWIRREMPELPVALAGWSFGGAVAVRTAAEDDQVISCVGIAPAVKEKPDVTAGLPGVEDVHLEMPVLFVCGANDELIAPDECRGWVERLPNGSFVEIAGANHFFWAKYDRLAETVCEFLEKLI
jgi:alpha/beta superfamily hydrolase